MQRPTLTLLALICLGAGPPDFAGDVLAVHNEARRAVGSAPLKWSPALARDAENWARDLVRTGRFEHAERKGQGENLWTGSKGDYTAREMVGAWAGERSEFQPGRFPRVSKTGDVADVGHYTQMIWHATTDVGCAVASGSQEDVLVCRYSPPGNFVGQSPLAAQSPKKAPRRALRKRRPGG